MAARLRVPRRAATEPPHEPLDPQLLSQIEDQWLAERHRGETLSSESLLHDDYAGGASGGEGETKASFIARIGAWTGVAIDTGHSNRAIRQFGDTVVSTGVASVRTAAREHRFRYLRVYYWSDGAWRLVASQSTAVMT